MLLHTFFSRSGGAFTFPFTFPFTFTMTWGILSGDFSFYFLFFGLFTYRSTRTEQGGRACVFSCCGIGDREFVRFEG